MKWSKWQILNILEDFFTFLVGFRFLVGMNSVLVEKIENPYILGMMVAICMSLPLVYLKMPLIYFLKTIAVFLVVMAGNVFGKIGVWITAFLALIFTFALSAALSWYTLLFFSLKFFGFQFPFVESAQDHFFSSIWNWNALLAAAIFTILPFLINYLHIRINFFDVYDVPQILYKFIGEKMTSVQARVTINVIKVFFDIDFW